MRVTNHMVTNSSLRNMQKSMQRVSRLNEQVTTGKKIAAPSEDPVVAIRALKLRTTCDQLDQYKNKNIKDAMSWLDTTQSSVQNIQDRLQDVYYYCDQGANDTLSADDRSKIINELRALKESIYREGGTTYAGRYLFSGYKTETNLVFQDASEKQGMAYTIEENVSPKSIVPKRVVLNEVNTDSLDDIISGATPYESPKSESVYALQLAYSNLDEADLNGNDFRITFLDTAGNEVNLPIRTMAVEDTADYYDVSDGLVHFIPETGEIIFSETMYNTVKNLDNISVQYNKSNFEVGDLRPEMYFNCTRFRTLQDGTMETIEYDVTDEGQPIQYEVNFNQHLTVNAEGKNVIKHSMGNDIEDMMIAVQDVIDIEKSIKTLKGYLEDPRYKDDEDSVKQINKMLEDADVELAMKRENMQKLFGNNMTNFQNYMSMVGAEQAKVGTNYSKLKLIETRVTEQLENFEELKSTNEDIETEEAALELYQSELVYESALATTSNVIKKTLLDYL